MSVSIEDELAEGGGDARAALAGWLDDYSGGRCELDDMKESVLSLCRKDPDAPWDALALLDQYTRRGRIEADLAQSLKADIERLVFGSQAASAQRARQAPSRPADPPPSETRRSVSPDSDPEPTQSSARTRLDPEDSRQHSDFRQPDRSQARPQPTAPTREPQPAARDATRIPTDSTSDLEPAPTSIPSAPTEPPPREMWPRLVAERDERSTRPGTAFVDRTLLRREPQVEPARDDSAAPASRRSPRVSASQSSQRPAAHDVLRDRYELLAVLGRGAAGTVYRAIDRHRSHLSEASRCVAVKVLNAKYDAQSGAIRELEREFHQAQSLSHPNIVSVFDLDRDGDTYFIVMELLEGRLLADILRQLEGRPMRRRHAFAIISSIGAALVHAHRREMVHADLKPRNVMITNGGEVRVLDFGFARNRALDLHSASGLHDAPAPSPAYASVERVNGAEPDASDDVYSLACIAYELLSGQHPFGGRSALLARAHGRRPPRIRGLSHKQSQALQRALLWTRGERKIDVIELLSALECGEAAGDFAAPEEILAPDDRGSRGWKAVAWLAFIAAVIAAAWYFAPRIVLRDSVPLTTAVPVDPPAAQREAQTDAPAPDAAPTADDARSEANPGAPGVASEPQQTTLVEEPSDPPPATPPSATSAAQSAQIADASTAAPSTAGPSASVASASPVTVEFDKDTYVATESDGSVKLVIRRNGSVRRPASFSWSLKGNSAEAGADFASIGPGVEQIPAGAREVSLTIPLVQDSIAENTELFLVELHASEEGVSPGGRSHAAVIIVDDD